MSDGTTSTRTRRRCSVHHARPDLRRGRHDLRDAGNLRGSGSLIAPGNVSITITNNSPAFLSVGPITIPQSSGGTVFFDGQRSRPTPSIGGPQSDTNPRRLQHPGCQHHERPRSRSRTLTMRPLPANSERRTSPAPISTSTAISLRRRPCSRSPAMGSVLVNANIDVGTSRFKAGADFVQSYSPGIDTIGGDPEATLGGRHHAYRGRLAARTYRPRSDSRFPSLVIPTAPQLEQAVATALATPGTGNIIVGERCLHHRPVP